MNKPYKLIIVDDEFFICDGLMSFSWQEIGFEAIAAAGNGEEALELIEKQIPDVILTDIKMPFMDGLELSKVLCAAYPQIKIVLLTGYKEFDYAKTAISTGVSEYLLKPVNISELKSLFLKLKNTLDEERKIPNMLKAYQKQIIESFPLAVENFLKCIIEEKIHDYAEIEEKINLLELNLNYNYYACAIFKSDDISNSWHYEEVRKSISSLMDNVKQYLQTNHLGYSFINHNFEIIVLFCFNLPENAKSSYQFLMEHTEKIKIFIDECFKQLSICTAVAGIGNIYKNILSASASFKQARSCLKRKFFDYSKQIFYAWNDRASLLSASVEYPYQLENNLIDTIMEGDMTKSLQCFHEYWHEFNIIIQHLDTESIQSYSLQLLNMIDRRLNKHETSLGELSNIYPPYISFITSPKSFIELEELIRKMILHVVETISKINNEVKSSSHLSIQMAKKYIEEHFNEKITLNQVAEHVYLNPSYFSIQFKKETDVNFVKYLKNIRIQKASELLKRVDLKVYEVGAMVGYDDPTYFANTFKNHTGVTPMEFKRKFSLDP